MATPYESRIPQANGTAGELPTQANRMAAEMAQKAKEAIGSVGADMTKLICSNPLPAVLIALGVGFLVARVTNRSQVS